MSKEYIKRIVTERDELGDKIKKLSVFVNSEKFKEIYPMQQNLLYSQLNAMQTYYGNKKEILENINNIIGKNLDEVFEKIEALNTVIDYQTYILNNRTCENCKYCSAIFDNGDIQCDFFECYQQKALIYCGNWEQK